MGRIETFIETAKRICKDDSIGYSQINRWLNPDVDCSSFVYICAKEAGYTTRWGSGYTGTMLSDFTAAGFEKIPYYSVGLKGLLPGDILLNTTYHTEIYIGDGYFAGANKDENGGSKGLQGGDQTGVEVYIKKAYEYSKGWEWVLRPPKDGGGSTVQLYHSNASPAQMWRREYVKTVNGRDYYIYINKATGKVLDVRGAKAYNGAAIWAYPRNNSDAQLFCEETLVFALDTCFILHSLLDYNLCVDVAGAQVVDGTRIQLYNGNGTTAQKFVRVYAGLSGYYYYVNQYSGKPLDVLGGV